MRIRTALTVLLAVSGLALAACSSPSDGPDAAGNAAKSGSSSKVPVADVVSSIKDDSTLHDQLPASVRRAGSLSFGTPLQQGTSGLPYVGSVGSKYVGLHLDLANAIAKTLGVKAKIDDGTFPTIVPGVQNGKYDVGLANLGVTAEREKVVDYATYLTDGQAFLGAKSVKLTKVTSLADLCGLTVATAPGSTFQQLLDSGKNDCAKAGKKPYTVQYFSTNAPVFLGLANGKIDIDFGPTLSLKYDAKHIAGTKFLGQISSTPVGFVTAKHSPLTRVLQQAVEALIKSGAYRRILAKWGVTGNAITHSEFNPKPSF